MYVIRTLVLDKTRPRESWKYDDKGKYYENFWSILCQSSIFSMYVYRVSWHANPVSNNLAIMFVLCSTRYSQYCLLITIASNSWALHVLDPQSLPDHSMVATSSPHRDISSQIFSAHCRYLEMVRHVWSRRTKINKNRWTMKPPFVQRTVSYDTWITRLYCYNLSLPDRSHVKTYS